MLSEEDKKTIREQEAMIPEIEKTLFQKDWKQEAQQIPVDALPDKEKKILEKYLSESPLQEDEKQILKETLGRYRPAIQKIDPEQTIENIKENIEIVNDEKEFLQLIQEYKQPRTITFNYPLTKDREVRLELEVLPITDSMAVLDIQNNLSLFKDLTTEEANVYAKMQQGVKLNREELIIQEHLQEKINKATQENQKTIIVEFLSMTTKFKDKPQNYESMKQMYSNMDIAYLALLFTRVQEMTGLMDLDVERIFREA